MSESNGRYHHRLSAVNGAYRLGWTSIGIGMAEIGAPQVVASLLGIEDSCRHRGILRVLGVREIVHGVSLLTERRPSPQMTVGVWSRVLGDALDTALLGIAATKTRRPGSFAAVAASVLAIGALDLFYSVQAPRAQFRRR